MFKRALTKCFFIPLALMLVLTACTDESLNTKSGPTSYHLIDSARLSANGRILYMAERNGNFEVYSAEASNMSQTTLDPSGNQIGYGFLDANRTHIAQGATDPSYDNYALQAFNTSSFLVIHSWYKAVPAPKFDVEVRFGPGMSQNASSFGIAGVESYFFGEMNSYPERPGLPNHFIDYVAVPFEVWDVTNNRQLMVSFHDENGNGRYDLVRGNFDTSCRLEFCELSEEYIYISDTEYTVTQKINTNENPSKNLAYTIWPILAPGATWSPAQLPQSMIRINFNHSSSLDYSSEAVRNFSVGGNEIIISTTDNSANLGIQAVSSFDRSFYPVKTLVTTHQPQAQIRSAGLFPLSDKGFLAGSRMVGSSFDSIRFVKLDGSLNPVFSAEISTDQLGTPLDFSPVFIETDDNKYVFLFYNPLTSIMKKFEVTPGGIILQSIELGNDLTYPVDLLNLPAASAPYRYLLLFKDGLIQLLDKDFNSLKNYAAPSHGFGAAFRVCNNVAGDIFYSCTMPGSGSSTQLLMAYINTNDPNATTFKVFDLGANIISRYSCIQSDGNVATIVQIQRSLGTQDLLFFRTDKSLNTIK